VPELGAKITRLVARATGRDWLWTNPHRSRRPFREGDSYVRDHDTGGIDECFPAVHGVAWAQAWRVEERTRTALALAARDPEGAWTLRRRLEIDPSAPRLALAYELESHAPAELPFVWCLHALFATEPGMAIELPAATPIRVAAAHGVRAGADLFRVPDAAASPFAAKLFAGPLARGEVALRAANGRDVLRIGFDPREVPFLGLWLNHGRWSGAKDTPPYRNLALEPSIGDADALEEAVARGTAGRLAPGARCRWRIGIELAS
jgi:galactose mutarotase-like enzyme